jgi:hypothetical protein|nr:MAG TPA: hypothetical protein [Caudoviricetes sp.]
MQQIKNKKMNLEGTTPPDIITESNKDIVVNSQFGTKVIVSDDLIRVVDVNNNVVLNIGKRGIKIDIDDPLKKHANVYIPREDQPSVLDCVYCVNNDPVYIIAEEEDNTGNSNELWFDFVNVNS